MDEKRLQEIRARCEAATPGPWRWSVKARFHEIEIVAPQNGTTTVMDFVRWGMQNAQPRFNDCSDAFGGILRTWDEFEKGNTCNPEGNPNAAFIAHARRDIPDLLAEVERLAAELSAQSEIVQRDWLSPVEAAALRAQLAALRKIHGLDEQTEADK